MAIYGQGNNYEEEEVDTVSELGEEDSPSQPENISKNKIQINPKIIALGCSGAALVAIIFGILIWAGNSRRNARNQAEQQAIFENLKAQEELKDEIPDVENDQNDIPVQSVTNYSQKELDALRLWGYTADQIELASKDGLSAKALVQQAKHDRQLAQQEAMEAVLDTASPEFQELLNKTWLGGAPIDMESVDPNVIYNNTSAVQNVDYEKCGAQGTQLFLKLYLDDGTAAFMTVTPNRWKQLNESGNIVVEITWRVAGEVSIITDIHEVVVE